MAAERMHEQIREQNTFRLDEEWKKSDEQDKIDLFNQVLAKNEWKLRTARRLIERFHDPGQRDAPVIGHLYWMAYDILNSAINEAITHDVDKEKFEKIVEEFEETVEPHTVYDMKRWSGEHAKELNGRMPAQLRTLMDEKGSTITQLITFAYTGTEAVTEGASEESTPSISDD